MTSPAVINFNLNLNLHHFCFLETSAACGLFVSFSIPGPPWRGDRLDYCSFAFQLPDLTFFCRCTRIAACHHIPASDRQAETLGGINKHAEANALFARPAKKYRFRSPPVTCYFAYCYFFLDSTAWSLLESPSHTLFPLNIHGSTEAAACACQQPPQDETIESRKETSSIVPKADWPFWKQILFAATAW